MVSTGGIPGSRSDVQVTSGKEKNLSLSERVTSRQIFKKTQDDIRPVPLSYCKNDFNACTLKSLLHWVATVSLSKGLVLDCTHLIRVCVP